MVTRGSPPRVRGKVTSAINGGISIRITPACAGKSKTVDVNGRIM